MKLAVVSVMPFDAICETREAVFLLIVKKKAELFKLKKKTNNPYRVLRVLKETFLCYLEPNVQTFSTFVVLNSFVCHVPGELRRH